MASATSTTSARRPVQVTPCADAVGPTDWVDIGDTVGRASLRRGRRFRWAALLCSKERGNRDSDSQRHHHGANQTYASIVP